MNWEEVARDSFKDQLPAIELFIESVNKSVDEHDRERELVQHFSPLKARDQLKELLPPMRRASHKLASLEAGTRSLTKLLAWNAELGTHENLGDELNDMQHLHDRWLQHFEQVYEILKKKDAFKGDKNPQTYARLRFQKMIFVFYMAAFELESPLPIQIENSARYLRQLWYPKDYRARTSLKPSKKFSATFAPNKSNFYSLKSFS